MMVFKVKRGKNGETTQRITTGKMKMEKFILSMVMFLVAVPAFSQTRQTGSTYSDSRRSIASSTNTQNVHTLNNKETSFIHFRNVSTVIDPDYMDNSRVLAMLDRIFADYSINDRIDNVTITGSASPDGYTDRNEMLAEERAYAIKRYITRNHPHVNSNRIITYVTGEDWDGLRQMIADDYATPARNEALRILNSTLSGDAKRKQLQQLASGRTYRYLSDNMFPSLRGGAALMIFYKKDYIAANDNSTNYTGITRTDRTTSQTSANGRGNVANSSVTSNSGNMTNYNIAADQVNITNYTVIAEAERRTIQTPQSNTNNTVTTERERRNASTPERKTSYNESPVRNDYSLNYRSETKPVSVGRTTSYNLTPSSKQNLSSYSQPLYDDGLQQEKMIFAVKTNLLFDAVTALNVELEAPLGNNWSLAGEYIFPWWLNEQRQFAFQLITANLELRRWFGDREERPKMTGWFGGFFIGGGYFDFQRGSTGYQGESFITGLSGGYAHEISRDGKWRMEYALGLGLIRTNYREYLHRFGLDSEWHLIRQKTGQNTYVGPVKAKISLVRTLNIKK